MAELFTYILVAVLSSIVTAKIMANCVISKIIDSHMNKEIEDITDSMVDEIFNEKR